VLTNKAIETKNQESVMEFIARDLLQYTTEAIWDILPDAPVRLVFDDRETIDTTGRMVIYSSYFWEAHRRYPNTPLLKKHHVSSILKGGYLNKSTHIQLLNVIYWDVAQTYNLNTPAARDDLTKLMYEITNNLYNELSCRLEEYVVTMDLLDFLEVDRQPDIHKALNTVTATDESISQTYKVILDQLYNNPALDHNSVAFATRSGMVNKNQVVQCVGPRGYVTEVDGYIMKVPILRGFFRGMRSAYNAISESHSAGKALFFAEAPLQEGEYFSRRLQLMTMSTEVIERDPMVQYIDNRGIEINHTHNGDCGSTDYLSWNVKGPVKQGEDEIYPGDLKFLAGKYYLDQETNTLKPITKNDKHLIGKTLKIRTVLGCKHHNKHGVCSVCFGKMGDNVSPYANIGHLAAAMMTQQITQSILSTKHLIASSSSEAIYLPEAALRILKVNNRDSSIFIHKEWKNKGIEIIVSSSNAHGLSDLEIMDDIDNINPVRVSAIEFMEIRYMEGKHQRHLPVHTDFHGCPAILTSEFLHYLKLHGWETDQNGNFIFTFDNWDFSKPVFSVPQKEYSYARHASEISGIIESRLKDITDRIHPDSPKATLMELFDLVNSKLSVNIVCLEVIMYSIMCADITNNKFGLARNHKTAGLGVRELIIFNRSLSAAYAYERLGMKVINRPSTFFKNDRDDSLFDVFLDPYRVVKEYIARART